MARKAVFIYGASGSLGLASSLCLAQKQEYDLYLFAGRYPEKIKRAFSDHGLSYVRTESIDLSGKDGSFIEQSRRLLEAAERPYALLYFAGLGSYGLARDLSAEEHSRLFHTNYFSYCELTRLFTPFLLREGEGRILACSSIWGLSGAAMEAAYSASKAALIAYNHALAGELGSASVTVNTLAPGWIVSPMNQNFNDAEARNFAENTALRRLGRPEEVAALSDFLLSKRAAYITGEVLKIDGGYL